MARAAILGAEQVKCPCLVWRKPEVFFRPGHRVLFYPESRDIEAVYDIIGEYPELHRLPVRQYEGVRLAAPGILEYPEPHLPRCLYLQGAGRRLPLYDPVAVPSQKEHGKHDGDRYPKKREFERGVALDVAGYRVSPAVVPEDKKEHEEDDNGKEEGAYARYHPEGEVYIPSCHRSRGEHGQPSFYCGLLFYSGCS